MQTLKIMLLGPSGSGKTVFLGSLYHRLHTQHEDIGFFLNTDFWRQRKLIEIFRQIAQTAEWPDATQYSQVEEWHFVCSVKDGNKVVYNSFEFSYVDYSGERLTGTRYQESKEFETALKEANIYVGLLDGQKVLELMHGEQGVEERVDEFVFSDLPNLLAVMERSAKPIHFIITKWDLLEGNYELRQIRDKLLAIPEFGNFIRTHVKHNPVRLIPVSSVGSNFADPQEDGTMRKRVGAYPQPFQVEMALACILLDNFLAHWEEVAEQHPFTVTLFRKGKPKLRFWNFIGRLARHTVYSLLKNFPEIREIVKLDDKTFEEIVNFTKDEVEFLKLNMQERSEEAKKKKEILDKRMQESLNVVENERAAVKLAVNSFMALQKRLEYQFPESLLQEDKN